MKINLSDIPDEYFMVHQHLLFNEPVVLVQPIHIGAKYTKDTTIFRSSVWDNNGNLVSPGFKKFFNSDETPLIDPLPENISDGSVIEKVDGSLAIFSVFNGNLVIRTRGTIDAKTQLNGSEFEYLSEKYNVKRILDVLNKKCETTLLFEITSPTQKIVLDYGSEPDLWLIGAIKHADYSYYTQNELDMMSEEYDLNRPKRYLFNSIEELRKTVEEFKGIEGVCLYYSGDQCIRKFKSFQYLYLHRAKSEISSIEKVMDLYLATPQEDGSYMPYQAFMEYLEKTFDYEIAGMARGHVSNICDAMKEARTIITAMRAKLATISGMSRKDQAGIILQAWGTTGRSALAFKMLDGKPLVADDYKKLLFQVLK